MKPLNIAICLSGETRTWEHCLPSLKHFFGSDTNKLTFFGHTWDNSVYTKEGGQTVTHDCSEMWQRLQDAYVFSGLVIDNKNILDFSDNEIIPDFGPSEFSKKMNANTRKPRTWAHMSYSILRANELKQKYEQDNDMRFDLVVRTRFDLCYRPTVKFMDLVDEMPLPTALYCENFYFADEFYLSQINDIFYWGNSRIMDVVDGFYRYYGTGKFHQMIGEHYNDCAYKVSGYGVNLYKWVTLKNITIRHVKMNFPAVLRTTAQSLDWSTQFDQIIDADRRLFS